MRLRIDFAYDGAGFHGWAKQPGLRTVQGDFEQAMDLVLRTKGTQLTVAGRTDTGVHARHQVAHADLDPDKLAAATSRATSRATSTTMEVLARRLNGVLQEDVRVRRFGVAPPGFDARFSALWRRYVYRIADRPEVVDPLQRAQVLDWPHPLDVAAMNRAAAPLLGEHDFGSFCRRREGATTVRTLRDLAWERTPEGLVVATIRADAFCHNMVRSLVGCMVAIGEGRYPPGWAGELLDRRARDPRVRVLRPHGLTLEEVAYPPDEEVAAHARITRVVRILPEGT